MLTVRWARGLLSVLIVLMLNPFIPTLGACDESPTPASPTGLVEEASIPSLDPSEGTLLGLVDGQIVENLGQKGLGGGELFIEGGPLSVAFFPGQVSYFLRGEGDLDGYHFSMSFEGGRDVVPEGLQPLDHRTNYFLGNDPDRWIRGARSFTGVGYEEVWSSIDVRFSLTDDHLKYDAIVLPGGDPGEVLLRFNSVDALDIDGPTGDLLISTPAGIVRDKAPFAYQDGVDGTVQVPVRYDLVGTDSVGFEVGYYDPSRPLVIDPEMEYSTFIGGSGDDFPGDWDTIVADDMGHVYMSGSTKSSNFPIELGAYDSNINGNLDLFVLKFNETTQTLDYSTYIGGSTDDRCSGIVVNETGCVVLLAGTNGGNFPATTGAYDTSYNGRMDNAIVKLKPDGSDLVFSTFVGGSGNDRAGGIDLDKYGNVYVVGWELQVGGGNFPTTGGSYDPSFNGNNDGFVYKLKSDGSGPLIFSTYIGGSYWEHMTGIHVYDDGSVIFAGYTNSGNFPTKAGAHQRNIQGSGFPLPYEGTVSKLSADGSDLLLSTFFGGTARGMCTLSAPRKAQTSPTRPEPLTRPTTAEGMGSSRRWRPTLATWSTPPTSGAPAPTTPGT